jgi:hypothetical protein
VFTEELVSFWIFFESGLFLSSETLKRLENQLKEYGHTYRFYVSKNLKFSFGDLLEWEEAVLNFLN